VREREGDRENNGVDDEDDDNDDDDDDDDDDARSAERIPARESAGGWKRDARSVPR